MAKRIHIFGASGSGTTTLGKLLAARMLLPCFDSDQFYWENWPIDFIKKREPADREKKLGEALLANQDWILSGSIDGWDSSIQQDFTHLIFLYLEPLERLRRLRQREIQRFGAAALEPGGAQHEQAEYFLSWASHYDDGTLPGRSLPRHEAWMKALFRPVLRLNSEEPTEILAAKAMAFVGI